jgi:hypothetical membrane protein
MGWGGIVGPVAFVAAWIACGRATVGYSPRHDAISELAAIGATTRVAMTVGFVVFGVGLVLYAGPLGRAVGGRADWAAALCGLATLGVAAIPLGWFSDGLHGALAGIGYAALAATPVLASRHLARIGHAAAAWASVAVGAACAGCLVLSAFGANHGLFQRLGLTIGDAWVVASAAAILSRGRRSSAVVGGGALQVGPEHGDGRVE